MDLPCDLEKSRDHGERPGTQRVYAGDVQTHRFDDGPLRTAIDERHPDQRGGVRGVAGAILEFPLPTLKVGRSDDDLARVALVVALIDADVVDDQAKNARAKAWATQIITATKKSFIPELFAPSSRVTFDIRTAFRARP